VELLTPNGGEAFGAWDELRVQWASEDSDSRQLQHTLYYSPDGGERWIVLASGLTGSEFLWKLSDTPGTADSSGLLRIVVSDGFNSGEDQSDGRFRIVGKPPQVVILAPRQDSTFLQCERLHLDGVAQDPEGRLDWAFWTLDGQQIDAQLRDQIEALQPGQHNLVLTAVDEQELVATDDVTFTVLADSDCDGMSDGFEQTHNLDPGFVGDAAWDLDEDGLPSIDEAWYGTSPVDDDSDGDGYPDGEEIERHSDPTNPEDTPARVYVLPAQESVAISDTVTLELRVDDIHDLYGVQVELTFAPAIVQVEDAYDFVPGIQIEEGDFPTPEVVIRNQVDNETGSIQYAVSLLGSKPGIDGSGLLARVTLHGRAEGVSGIRFTRLILSDPQSAQISARAEEGAISVRRSTGDLTGRVILERRPSNGGANVCVSRLCTTTAEDGSYLLPDVSPGPQAVMVSRESYLRTWREVDVPIGLLELPEVTLLAGDVNGDDHIEQFDAMSLGFAWNSTPMDMHWDGRSDITDDGNVNILDMVGVQFNWDARAPGPWEGAFASEHRSDTSVRELMGVDTATRVVLVPGQSTLVGTGERVDLEIQIQDVTGMYGGRVQLTFDPAVIRVLDADPRGSSPGVQIYPGDFLDTFNQLVLVNQADNEAGTIDYAVTQLHPAVGRSGSGVLARIRFEALGAGSSPVHLAALRLGDDTRPDPVEIPAGTQDGQVIVWASIYLPIVLVQ